MDNQKCKGQYFTKDKSLQKCVSDFILNNPNVILEPSIGRGDLIDYLKNNQKNIINYYDIKNEPELDKFYIQYDMYEIDNTIEWYKKINKIKYW